MTSRDQIVIPEEEMIRRILKVLSIYPRISPTMLQVGIGPQIPPRLWQPILEKMVLDGLVHREYITSDSQSGRFKTFTIITASETNQPSNS